MVRGAVLGVLLSLPALGACKDDPSSGDSAKAKVDVEIQATDVVECGFGGTRAAGPWDEVTLHVDGSIKWTHVDAANKGSAGFEKTGTLAPEAARAWMKEVAGLGLVEGGRQDVPGDGERTICRGTLGGKAFDFQAAGLPDAPLRSKLDALMAQAIDKP
jgi:hypothetical protein